MKSGFVYIMASARRQIKQWKRQCKLRLIEEINPDWEDLYPALF